MNKNAPGNLISAFGKYAGGIEKGLCFAALALMAILPVTNALFRPFNIVIPFTRFLLLRLFLVSALLAAMLATRGKEHISIALVQYAKNEKIKTIFSCICGLISSFVATILFWDSISFIQYSLMGRQIGFIPDWIFALAMPIAYGIMAIRFGIYSVPEKKETGKLNWYLALPLMVILLGCAAALPAIAKIFWGFDPPEPFFSWVNSLYDFALHARTPIIIFFIVAALSGTPIFVSICGIALVMLQAAGTEPDTVPIQIYSALTDTDIIAIPLFTLTGFFLSESKAGERLVAAFRSFFSWLPGGMIIVTVVICAFFTSFTGASGVTILALGGILYTILKEKLNYPENFSVGLLTSSGCVGLLFPPSLVIILVGSSINSILFFMGESFNYDIFDFFIGALIPGIVLVLTRIIFGLIISAKVKIPKEPFRPKEAGTALKGSVLEILLPIILVAGYFSGILTLLEVSALSVVYIFIVEVLIHKDISLKDVPRVFAKAVPIIGGILIILSMAKALSYAFIDSRVPEQFANWMQTTVESKIMFLLLLNLALLVLGSLMDIFSAILVVLPLIIPLAIVYGIDPIHLGIIFIVNLEVGFLTPPVGMNLFLASYRFKKPFVQICRYVLPFLIMQLGVVFLVTYVPWLSTFLVGLFK